MKKVIIALLVLASLFAFVSCKEVEKDDAITFEVLKGVKYVGSSKLKEAAKSGNEGVAFGGTAIEAVNGVYTITDLDFAKGTNNANIKLSTAEKADARLSTGTTEADELVVRINVEVGEDKDVESFRWFYKTSAGWKAFTDTTHDDGIWEFEDRIFSLNFQESDFTVADPLAVAEAMLEVVTEDGVETYSFVFNRLNGFLPSV